ncbi:MAG: hypothetical protein KA198_06045 [Chitinophagaceae bacterium]|nr:hypothetical protein [Chitinophagaceae bacterium]
MVLNYVWISFFVVAFIVALIRTIFPQVEADHLILKTMVDGLFDAAESSVMKVALPLTGVLTFFMGLLKIGEKAGAINFLSRLIGPFLTRLFPGVPKNHPAIGQMVMNFSANMLGLDNAATPFGLKAMQSLQELNPEKEKATNAQIMFLVLHTSGLTLIPLTIMSYRASNHSVNVTSIFIPCVLATVTATLMSIFIVGIYQKLKFDWVVWSWILGILASVISLMFLVHHLSPAQKDTFSNLFGNIALLVIIIGFILAGLIKKISVFDSFIEGAKEGFDVVLKIIPYLVAMLVGIRLFRDSGALMYVTDFIGYGLSFTGINTDFVPAIPVALMKPFSGSGARGLMLEVFANPLYGPDSFVGNTASILQGSADTTFYILALYFGSVGIRNVRYAVWAGLLADFLGVVCAIIIAYIFFH